MGKDGHSLNKQHDILIAGAGYAGAVAARALAEKGRYTRAACHIAEPVACLALLTVCTAYLIDGSFNPFLYFRF